MSLFRYEAVDPTGKIIMGAMDDVSEAGVSARLSQMGYRPMTIIAAGSNGGNSKAAGGRRQAAGRSGQSSVISNQSSVAGAKSSITQPVPPIATQPIPATSKLGGAKPKDLALFFRQFAALVKSGITLYQALDNLGPRTPHPALKQTAGEMAEAANTGGRISDVMEKYPRLFASHVVASVRAGETGGFLDIILDEIAYDYEQDLAFYKGTWLAKVLVIQGIFALAIAQPLFPTLFPNYLNEGPSAIGKYLILVFLRNIPITLILMGLYMLWYRRMQLPENRYKRDRIALRTPVFGDLMRQKALASFVRTLRKLFGAGVGPVTAWEGAMNVAPNAVIREKLVESYDMMQHNVPLHEAFSRSGLFANETEQLLATGVMSGQMVDMLDRVAEYYQDNVDRAWGNARFWMFRLGFCLTIILIGALFIIMYSTYFKAIFDFPKKMFPELEQ